MDLTTRLVYSPEGTQLATIIAGFFSHSSLPSTVGENSVSGKVRQQEISFHISYSLISLYHTTEV